MGGMKRWLWFQSLLLIAVQWDGYWQEWIWTYRNTSMKQHWNRDRHAESKGPENRESEYRDDEDEYGQGRAAVLARFDLIDYLPFECFAVANVTFGVHVLRFKRVNLSQDRTLPPSLSLPLSSQRCNLFGIPIVIVEQGMELALEMRTMKDFYVFRLTICFILAGLGLFARAGDEALPSTVKNAAISIVDIEGKERFPFRVDETKGAALIFVTHDCPISNAYSPELARLKKEYGSKGFSMTLVFVDPDVTKKEIMRHMEEYGLSGYTAVVDKSHKLVKEAGATVTPEAVVVLGDGVIAYRGRIDNMFPELGKRRRVITEKDLRSALDAVIENRPVEASRTQAIGCYIPNL
jgi:hypothetical protein